MRKFSIFNAAVFLCAVLILSGLLSCKKDSPAVKSRTELITQATWKLVKSELKTGSGAWVDQTASIPACEKDDLYVLRANGTYESNEGATKCSPSDPQIYDTGTWMFQTNETQLKTTSTGSSSPDIVTIETLTETTLAITETYTSGGTTYYYRGTFGH